MINRSKLPKSVKIYLSLVIFFLILTFIMPRSTSFNYDYKKGTPWAYDNLVSQFDFPILKSSQQLQREREALSSNYEPYYNFDNQVYPKIEKEILEYDFSDIEINKAKLLFFLSSAYKRGVIVEVNDDFGTSNADYLFIQKGKRVSKYPISEVYTISSLKQDLLSYIDSDNSMDIDSLLNSVSFWTILKANLIYDKESTELVHEQNTRVISTTQGYITKGTVLVSKGELVTAEIQQILDSYKAEYKQSVSYNGPVFFLWLGNAIISFIISVLLFFSILFARPSIFNSYRKFIFIIFIVLSAILLTLFIDSYKPRALYIIPYYVIALYFMAFFKKRVIVPVYIISLIPLLLFAHNGIELFFMNILSGILALYIYPFFSQSWKQFVMAFIIFITMLTAYIGFKLTTDLYAVADWKIILYIFIGSLLEIAVYPLIYLFEKMFSLLSDWRLRELTDTNNKLLLNLAENAPGTFQHSLQVMNIAGYAARAIEADELLIRAGALYHDIGKTKNPQCFVENESVRGAYHKDLSPIESARDIIKHVEDGLQLAKEHKLPKELQDFIISHHGTTRVGYFYNKYINDGGDPADKDQFTYPGMKPQTKEQVILMLADTLEAASRTLQDTSEKSFEDFVEKMTALKISEGQFDEADITIRELNEVKKSLKSYLAQIYHDRIAYPQRRNRLKK